jgi:hypothetical protein
MRATASEQPGEGGGSRLAKRDQLKPGLAALLRVAAGDRRSCRPRPGARTCRRRRRRRARALRPGGSPAAAGGIAARPQFTPRGTARGASEPRVARAQGTSCEEGGGPGRVRGAGSGLGVSERTERRVQV